VHLQDRFEPDPTLSRLFDVGAFGSIPVPLSSSEDSPVKKGGGNIPAGPCYDRHFALVRRLPADLRRAHQCERIMVP
jgi:hypothetical protein